MVKKYLVLLLCFSTYLVPTIIGMERPYSSEYFGGSKGEGFEEFEADLPSYFYVKPKPPTITRQYFADYLINAHPKGGEETFFRTKMGWNPKTFMLENLPKTKQAFDAWKQNWIFDEKITIEGEESYPRAAIFQGDYEFKTLRDLNEMFKTSKPVSSKPSFRLKLFDPNNPAAAEVIHMQGDPLYKRALFLLASTFWGPLEGGIVKGGALLANMYPHAVQGEDATVGAIGGAYWRKYFEPTMRRNTKKRKITDWPYDYLLHYLNKAPMRPSEAEIMKGDTRHSYIPFSAIRNYHYDPKDKEQVGIGIHRDLVAVFKGGEKRLDDKGYGTLQLSPVVVHSNGEVDTSKTQIISQAFVSAYNIAKARRKHKVNSNMKSFCRMILEADYEAAIKTAIVYGIPKVVLTLVGGSAFANDIAWIGQAIEKQKDLIKNYGLDVTVVYYPPDNKRLQAGFRNEKDDQEFLNHMLQVADYVNGTELALAIKPIVQKYLHAAIEFNKSGWKKEQQFKEAAKNIEGLL